MNMHPQSAPASAAGEAVAIRVNEEPRAVGAGTTVADLVRGLGLAERKGVAIAINDAVVPRSGWSARLLAEGDRVLVIRATQGG